MASPLKSLTAYRTCNVWISSLQQTIHIDIQFNNILMDDSYNSENVNKEMHSINIIFKDLLLYVCRDLVLTFVRLAVFAALSV